MTTITEIQEITPDQLKELTGVNSPSQFFAHLADFLQKHESAFLQTGTIKQLLVDPPPEVTDILNKADRIIKTGNKIRISAAGRISYSKGMVSASIEPYNTFEIKTLNKDLILMDVSGLTYGLLTLSKIRITHHGAEVYAGKIFGWKNVVSF